MRERLRRIFGGVLGGTIGAALLLWPTAAFGPCCADWWCVVFWVCTNATVVVR